MIPHHVEGSGPPVLLIQGVGVAGQAWAPQVEPLKDRYTLAWYDNPGIGASPGPPTSLDHNVAAALEVLDALGWQDAHVAGHSLGGVIATRLALHAPQRVRSLALLCTFARGAATLSFTPSAMLGQLRTLLGTRDQRRRAFFELVSDPSIPADESAMRQLEQAFGRALCDLPPAARAQVAILMRADHRTQLDRIRVPALVIGGVHDRIAPIAQSRLLAAGLNADLVELDGGHAVPVQDAPAVNAALAAFWGLA